MSAKGGVRVERIAFAVVGQQHAVHLAGHARADAGCAGELGKLMHRQLLGKRLWVCASVCLRRAMPAEHKARRDQRHAHVGEQQHEPGADLLVVRVGGVDLRAEEAVDGGLDVAGVGQVADEQQDPARPVTIIPTGSALLLADVFCGRAPEPARRLRRGCRDGAAPVSSLVLLPRCVLPWPLLPVPR